jgi:hypothetical protein
MAATLNRQIRLKSRPTGIPQAEHFEIADAPLPQLADRQFLVRNEFLSVDPAMRGWVSAVANYSTPVGLGEVMRSFAAGTVVASRHPDYAEGERVTGMFGWQEFAISDGASVTRRVKEVDLPLSLSLGVLGVNGVTAFFSAASVTNFGSIVGINGAGIYTSSFAGSLFVENHGIDLVALEQKSAPETVDSLFRHAHSVKGMAASARDRAVPPTRATPATKPTAATKPTTKAATNPAGGSARAPTPSGSGSQPTPPSTTKPMPKESSSRRQTPRGRSISSTSVVGPVARRMCRRPSSICGHTMR